jgi:hypothetical protein
MRRYWTRSPPRRGHRVNLPFGEFLEPAQPGAHLPAHDEAHQQPVDNAAEEPEMRTVADLRLDRRVAVFRGQDPHFLHVFHGKRRLQDVERKPLALVPLRDDLFETETPGMSHAAAHADPAVPVADQVGPPHVGSPSRDIAEIGQHLPDPVGWRSDFHSLLKQSHQKT